MINCRILFSASLIVSIFLFGCKGKSDQQAVSFPKKPAIETIAGFEVLEGGDQVRDPATDLVWLRCGHGQIWKDGRCVGNQIEVNLAQAKKAAPPGWRLASIRELTGLFDCSKGQMVGEFDLRDGLPAVRHSCRDKALKPMSAIHPALGVSEPSQGELLPFWSSTLDESNSSFTRMVYLARGEINALPNEEKIFVRFVRQY